MAIPSELTFSNEFAFTERFVIPLLRRLGFSLVVNYHGTREFGKDVVFGEIDRFGDVIYHGLQSKYLPSISQNSVEELITDARQAFVNPFRHPQKGNTERISSFFAVNAGSIADGAREHFFNSLAVPYGGNVRLIDGKALLALDRLATSNRVEWIGERLGGFLLELRVNRQTIKALVAKMEAFVMKAETFPIFRPRLAAVEAYLERPFLPSDLPYELIHEYWQEVDALNVIAESLGVPISTSPYKLTRMQGMKDIADNVYPKMDTLELAATDIIRRLGPLAAL